MGQTETDDEKGDTYNDSQGSDQVDKVGNLPRNGRGYRNHKISI